MGKKLKYCNSCEEGFAERFGFCPNCGAPLETFELNPVSGEVIPPAAAPEATVNEVQAAPVAEPTMPEFVAASTAADPFEHPAEDVLDIPEAPAAHFAAQPEEENILEATAAGSYGGATYTPQPTEAFSKPAEPEEPKEFTLPKNVDEDYHITVIGSGNTKQKGGLLLGATAFVLIALLTSVVVSIFAKDYNIASIGNDDFIPAVVDIDPAAVELPEKKPEPEAKDKSGGGGGGGNEDKDPASKGVPPAMMKDPPMAPDAKADRANTELKQQMAVKGPDQLKVDPTAQYGVLNGGLNPSNGPGTGGGIGTGRGGGVGSGNGSGLGSGSGGGAGAGNGGGIGDGSGERGGEPPPATKGETTPYQILSKPRAPYTDEARQNNFTGVVKVRVVLQANGQVGSVTPVTRLPYGLTESAIAAAKQIRFTPKKINGVAQAASVVVEYNFNIY